MVAQSSSRRALRRYCEKKEKKTIKLKLKYCEETFQSSSASMVVTYLLRGDRMLLEPDSIQGLDLLSSP